MENGEGLHFGILAFCILHHFFLVSRNWVTFTLKEDPFVSLDLVSISGQKEHINMK